jgi:hypothetical protein
MSQATFDLGIAERLRKMASELQARAAEQEDERGQLENFKRAKFSPGHRQSSAVHDTLGWPYPK